MKTKHLTLTFLLLLFCNSCSKRNEISNSDYLVFGHFHGECMGERCVEIFRLEDKKLFEDDIDNYPSSIGFYVGNYTRLPKSKFNNVKDLLDYFPTSLLSDTNKIIGQPDAGDWGGLYVEYNYNGVRKFWLIDKMKSNIPTEYHLFIDKINEKIEQLK